MLCLKKTTVLHGVSRPDLSSCIRRLASAGAAETSGARRACYLPAPTTAQPSVSVTLCWNWAAETERDGAVRSTRRKRPRLLSLIPLHSLSLVRGLARFPPTSTGISATHTRASHRRAPEPEVRPREHRRRTAARFSGSPCRLAPPPDPVSPRYPPRLPICDRR
jgi:hypothetical protein